jgi:glyoxylase-like metal-dependent hydrolase (beta-lactamase superfamily II)
MPYSNRREFLKAIAFGAVGMSFTYCAFGQRAPIVATKLSPSLALLTGDGGNVAVVIGSDGLMMIDGGIADRAGELQKAVADQVGPARITTLFNTHWHYDHVGSNETLGRSGAKIVAHENVKVRLQSRVTVEVMNRTFEPLAPQGLPAETFTTGGKMTFDKDTIEFTHVDPAHTDGDAYLFFPGSNVLHTGDLLFRGMYPVIDYSTGGWIGGLVAACDRMYKMCDGQTRVIPGHGTLASRDDLKATHDMLSAVQERLAPSVAAGRSADDVVASAPSRDLDERWGKGIVMPDAFVRAAYTSILRRNQRA